MSGVGPELGGFGGVSPPWMPMLQQMPNPYFLPLPLPEQAGQPGGLVAVPLFPIYGPMGGVPSSPFMPMMFTMPMYVYATVCVTVAIVSAVAYLYVPLAPPCFVFFVTSLSVFWLLLSLLFDPLVAILVLKSPVTVHCRHELFCVVRWTAGHSYMHCTGVCVCSFFSHVDRHKSQPFYHH